LSIRKKSQSTFYRHSGESRNPVLPNRYELSGPRFSPGWRPVTDPPL